MGQKEKLIEQLKRRPKTFTFHDAEVLLDYLEFTKSVFCKYKLPKNAEALPKSCSRKFLKVA